MEVNKELIINEISKTAFSDDEDIKLSDKLKALQLLNTIIKDSNNVSNNIEVDTNFIDDLE